MKKLMLTIVALSLTAGYAMADGAAESTFTLTNDNSVLNMHASTATTPHVLTAVVVSSPSTGGTLKIFNSTYTTGIMSTVTIIGLGSAGYYPFYDLRLKGIVYTTDSNAGGVTIIYKQ